MQGKTVLVTGATNGIGQVSAMKLAEQGARVLIGGRSREKAEAVAGQIRAAGGKADVVLADLSLLSGTRALAEQVLAATDRLDVLVNNAGAFFWERQETSEGHEMTFALNHMSYFVLTHALLDLLKRTAAAQGEARIVNVSSDAHKGSRLDLGDLEMSARYQGFGAYSRSKLMNVMFTYALARRLAGSGVTTNALHPGAVATGFGRNNSGIVAMGIRLLSPLMLSPEKGARTTVHLASAAEVRGVSGKYFSNSRETSSSAASYAVEVQERLWQMSEALAAQAQPA